MTSQTPHRYPPAEDLQHQNRIWAGIVAIVISAQCHILMMAQEASSHSEYAHWTDKEAEEYVLYLFANREKVGETGNFKITTNNEAAAHIAPYWQQGGRKTGKMCETKWTGLKKLYYAIREYKDAGSGVHWDDINGAGIEGDCAKSAWNTFLSQKGKSIMRPFSNKGWKSYEFMDAIIPRNSKAKGRASYRPKKAPPPSTNADTDPPDEPTTSAGPSSFPTTSAGPSSFPAISTAPMGSEGADAQAAGATAATSIYVHSTPASLSVPLDTSSANGKRSHSDMTHSLPPASTIATSVSTRSEALQQPSIPVKKSKTSSGRVATSRGDSAKGARVSKATTASSIMGFQSSINHLTDMMSERMSWHQEKALGSIALYR